MAVKGSLLTIELPLKPHREQEKDLNSSWNILGRGMVVDIPGTHSIPRSQRKIPMLEKSLTV